MDYQNIIAGKKYKKIVFSIIMILSLVMTDIYILLIILINVQHSMFIKNNNNCCLESIIFVFNYILYCIWYT